MTTKKDVVSLLLCYVLWGFQPLYWPLMGSVNSYVILACRIVMAAVFSVLLLAVTHRLPQLLALFRNRKIMRFLVPAVVFLFLDWAVFIVAVNAGHVLDVSLGYYVNPLLLFAAGVVIYREPCSWVQVLSLGIAVVGVVISTVAFGSFPLLSVVIAVNWAVYATLKKNVKVDGVVSIAAETLMLSPFALAFLAGFQRETIAGLDTRLVLLIIGSGVVTALPMFLYSNCVARFSLIVMCFAQYLSPTFNLVCGLIMGETFTRSQIFSLVFFIAAILLFTGNEIRRTLAGRKTVS